jgi:hypothetical protein
VTDNIVNRELLKEEKRLFLSQPYIPTVPSGGGRLG